MVKRYSKTVKEERLLKIQLDPEIVTLMALTFLTKNTKSTHKVRNKINEFLHMLDESFYEEDTDVLWRLRLAKAIGNAVLHKHASTILRVESTVMEDVEWAEYFHEFFVVYFSGEGFYFEGSHLQNELSDEDIRFIDEHVSTRLRYGYLWRMAPYLREVADKIEADDLGFSVEQFNEETLNTLEVLIQSGRKAKSISQFESNDFITGTESFSAAIRSAIETRRRPSSMIHTGVRMLDEMLGGGYEGSRVYVHFGKSGDGKSGMLCSAAFWACDPRFNPVIVTKDPTKKPCVLFLTQENDMIETIERMISFGLGESIDIKDPSIDIDMIIKALEDAFSSPTCRFVFAYRPSRSITTHDIDIMISDLATQGYEAVMVVQDYIKRIKSSDSQVNKGDARHLELGAIVDEFSNIAKKYNVPFVTAMQLNRSAYQLFDNAIASGKTDAIKELSVANVGESINVFENSDCVIFQGRVTSQALGGALFMTLRRAKIRARRVSKIDYFAQPFEIDSTSKQVNEMKLVEDNIEGMASKGLFDISSSLAENYDPQTQGHKEQTSHAAPQNRALNGGSGKGMARGKNSAPVQVSRSTAVVTVVEEKPTAITPIEIPEEVQPVLNLTDGRDPSKSTMDDLMNSF